MRLERLTGPDEPCTHSVLLAVGRDSSSMLGLEEGKRSRFYVAAFGEKDSSLPFYSQLRFDIATQGEE